MARWPGLVPDKDTESNIQVNVGGKIYNMVFAGGNTDDVPPIIPLTSVIQGQKTEVEKGKVKDGIIDVTVSNLLANTDTAGNLVISWTGPVVSTPYMNLYVYVGSTWLPDAVPSEAYFAWIEAVPQSSTVVLPKASWNFIKSTLSSKKYPKAQVMIIYQHQYMDPPSNFTPYGTTLQVRGMSDIVEIPY